MGEVVRTNMETCCVSRVNALCIMIMCLYMHQLFYLYQVEPDKLVWDLIFYVKHLYYFFNLEYFIVNEYEPQEP